MELRFLANALSDTDAPASAAVMVARASDALCTLMIRFPSLLSAPSHTAIHAAAACATAHSTAAHRRGHAHITVAGRGVAPGRVWLGASRKPWFRRAKFLANHRIGASRYNHESEPTRCRKSMRPAALRWLQRVPVIPLWRHDQFLLVRFSLMWRTTQGEPS